jgi:hypothetical protein
MEEKIKAKLEELRVGLQADGGDLGKPGDRPHETINVAIPGDCGSGENAFRAKY